MDLREWYPQARTACGEAACPTPPPGAAAGHAGPFWERRGAQAGTKPLGTTATPELLETHNCKKKTVEQNQAKSKAFTDKWWDAQEPKFECGSFVRIRKPGILRNLEYENLERKGDHKFTAPLKIIEKKGPYTYRLSDGWVWNTSYLAPAYAPRGDYANTQPAWDDFTVVPTQQDIALEPGLERRPVRPRRPPVWTRDYVM
ncbi:hypothetical protein UY3_05253 [Chelonia mydas]|uniref:Uncharacterized protein n=1 Tax=Chelonia mydas TaxID=8469 RepID=M7BK11_CHEMY|nr:hypothetical protein UY3_05253 [Chelonia mydas]